MWINDFSPHKAHPCVYTFLSIQRLNIFKLKQKSKSIDQYKDKTNWSCFKGNFRVSATSPFLTMSTGLTSLIAGQIWLIPAYYHRELNKNACGPKNVCVVFNLRIIKNCIISYEVQCSALSVVSGDHQRAASSPQASSDDVFQCSTCSSNRPCQVHTEILLFKSQSCPA